ncbi:MAG: DNRLRE domain-containing protein [Myxococcota bacterium]
MRSGLLLFVALWARQGFAQQTYVDDPLTAASFSGRGSQGGSFSGAGWTVTGEADAVWYEIADALPSARIEYTVTGLSLATSLTGVDHDLLTVYQAPTGQAEPVPYSPYFRNNDFKAFTRIFGTQEVGRGGAMKVELAACPRGDPWHHDTACPAGCEFSGIGYANGSPVDIGWDAATSYRMALEWGGGQLRLFRDGVLLSTVSYPGTYAPQPLRVRLGSPRHQGVYPGQAMMPLGIVLRDVLITGTPGVRTPVCGGAGGGAGGGGGATGGGTGGGGMTGGGAGGGGGGSSDAVLADVTAASWEPGVFPDVGDLNIEGDAAGSPAAVVYLRFPPPGGAVRRAVLTLHTQSGSSAAGGSGRPCAVADATWSEDTMTWATRPAVGACTGAALGVDPDQEVSWDVTPLFQAGPVGSLAIVSGDTNGAHYLSKESGGALAPRLRVELVPGPGDGGTLADAGAPELDGGAGGGAGAGGGSGGGATGGGGGSTGGGGGASVNGTGCGCSGASDGALVVLLLAWVCTRRGRRFREE